MVGWLVCRPTIWPASNPASQPDGESVDDLVLASKHLELVGKLF